MSLKMKLVSALAMMFLMVGVLIVGILGATQQTLTMTGNVQFNIADKSLYVKQVRIKQDNNSDPQLVTDFMPGYINGEFDMNIGDFTGVNSNTLGSFALYFDIINATDIQWAITNVTLSEQLQAENVKASYSGVIGVNDLTDTDSDGFKNFDPSTTEIDGTLILVISTTNSGSIDLSGITITISEYVPPVTVQVTSVSSSGATEDTYNDLTGQYVDSSVDLSGITFNTGETTLTVSMTSLSANYIKNKVSWVNTSGVTISSTSLYLPKNPSEQLTSGEKSKKLTITVNNTDSPTTISGLEVEFEEKTDLLQVTEEDETSTYTEEGYWYVEMGTYSTTSDNAEGKRESEYLRWRYFSDTTSHYEFNRNRRPTGEGYFILESYFSSFASRNEGGLYCSWNNDYLNASPYKHQLNGWTDIDANDYSTSTIRQYMNSEELVSKSYTRESTDAGTVYSPSKDLSFQSNMFTDLHIDPDNDIVYERIIGRTLGDLYTNMSDSETNPQDVDFPKGSPDDWTGATITYSREDTDKFWLLSYYEAYKLLSGNATTSSDTDRKWGNYYLLRSPYSSYSNFASYVNPLGILNSSSVNASDSAVRAAFKFSI